LAQTFYKWCFTPFSFFVRLVNDENFRWRAFRLIVRKRDGIFETPAGYGTAKDIDLGKVLQQQIDKIAATIPV